VQQFLGIGTGIPAANNTHEVTRAVRPEARVTCVDNDPIVLAHARALLTGVAGPAIFIGAGLRDVGAILTRAGETLNVSRRSRPC
jgi:precorrin-6B methylase 2